MRATAMRIPLRELEDATFVKVDEQYVPSYAMTRSGLKVSRVSVFGVVVRRYENERFASIKLDDFTGTIDSMAFGDSIDLLKEIKEGDSVKVIGKIKQGNNGLFIALEGIQKLDFYNEMHKRLEILECYYGYLNRTGKNISNENGALAEKEHKPSKDKPKENEKSSGKKKPMLADFISAEELHIERKVIE